MFLFHNMPGAFCQPGQGRPVLHAGAAERSAEVQNMKSASVTGRDAKQGGQQRPVPLFLPEEDGVTFPQGLAVPHSAGGIPGLFKNRAIVIASGRLFRAFPVRVVTHPGKRARADDRPALFQTFGKLG